jgi:2-polyprenyl-6-methoxyphenol hydroxylase-like FAD-dependent oxidoreductase
MRALPCFVPAGALLLGDAFNMRHPLTGGGMTVALSDTRLLCEMLQPLPNFEDSIATARSTAEFYTKRKPVSATINTLANALYKVRQAPSCRSVCWSTLCDHVFRIFQQKSCACVNFFVPKLFIQASGSTPLPSASVTSRVHPPINVI